MTTTSPITPESLAKVHHIVTALYKAGCFAKMPESHEPIALESFLEAIDDTLSSEGPMTGSYFVWHDYGNSKADRLYIGKDGQIKECRSCDIW